ncbi:hypothetical protein HDU96_007868 [Phlyctochytrium bullatum]|nr:hypothetical protein HDU96_007868 [Phlyctochytrium bullatum]
MQRENTGAAPSIINVSSFKKAFVKHYVVRPSVLLKPLIGATALWMPPMHGSYLSHSSDPHHPHHSHSSGGGSSSLPTFSSSFSKLPKPRPAWRWRCVCLWAISFLLALPFFLEVYARNRGVKVSSGWQGTVEAIGKAAVAGAGEWGAGDPSLVKEAKEREGERAEEAKRLLEMLAKEAGSLEGEGEEEKGDGNGRGDAEKEDGDVDDENEKPAKLEVPAPKIKYRPPPPPPQLAAATSNHTHANDTKALAGGPTKPTNSTKPSAGVDSKQNSTKPLLSNAKPANTTKPVDSKQNSTKPLAAVDSKPIAAAPAAAQEESEEDAAEVEGEGPSGGEEPESFAKAEAAEAAEAAEEAEDDVPYVLL